MRALLLWIKMEAISQQRENFSVKLRLIHFQLLVNDISRRWITNAVGLKLINSTLKAWLVNTFKRSLFIFYDLRKLYICELSVAKHQRECNTEGCANYHGSWQQNQTFEVRDCIRKASTVGYKQRPSRKESVRHHAVQWAPEIPSSLFWDFMDYSRTSRQPFFGFSYIHSSPMFSKIWLYPVD